MAYNMSVIFSGINIYAKDPVKSYEFYKGLGFIEKSEASPGDEWYGAEFDLGGDSTMWIWRDNSGDVAGGGGAGDDNIVVVDGVEDGGGVADGAGRLTIQIVLKCEDIDSTYEELISKGYAVTEPTLMFYGGKEMNLVDPDGNKLLFLD